MSRQKNGALSTLDAVAFSRLRASGTGGVCSSQSPESLS